MASSSQRTGDGSRRSTAPQSASSTTPTSPVREAVSATLKTSTLSTAASTARGWRSRTPSQTAAAAAHSNSVESWFGWRMLPMARPAMVGKEIRRPSASSGRNTCTTPTTTLSSPATSSAVISGVTQSSMRPARVAAAVACTSAPASTRHASGARRWPHGVLDVRMAATSSAPATSSSFVAPEDGCDERLGRAVNAQTSNQTPQPPKATTWLK